MKLLKGMSQTSLKVFSHKIKYIHHKSKKIKDLETRVVIAAEHSHVRKLLKMQVLQFRCLLIKGMSPPSTLPKAEPTTELKLIAQQLGTKSNKTLTLILTRHIGQKKMILSICLCSQSLTGKNLKKQWRNFPH